jgi:hypothetical protein
MWNNFFQMKKYSLAKLFWPLNIVILLNLFQLGNVQAQSIQLEVMASRTSWTNAEFVGHAFMCIAIPISTGIKEDCFGFYPRKGGKAFIGGPGVVNSEFQKNPRRFSRVTVSFKRPISEDQRRQIISMIDGWNSKDYNLTHRNCIDFVNSIAQMLGWRTPTRVPTDLPETYLRKLVEANRD